MKFIHRHLERQNRRLSDIYGADSSIQFRASNMCHIMLVYMAITGVLCLFATFYDLTHFTPKRMFYMGFLGAMFGVLALFYGMTLKGYFRKARFLFMAVNTVFVLPATLLTGGLPNSATMVMLPLPLLYAFCLYGGKKPIIYMVGYMGMILSIIFVPLILGLELPDFTQNEPSSIRKIMTFLILMSMLSFTLLSLQYENRRAVWKAKQAAAAKTDFLANMSHEIRTPMNGVLGLTDILMTKPMPPDQKELLRVVQSSGRSLLTIINDILDFSKLDAGQIDLDPLPFNLKAVLGDIRDLMHAQVKDKGLYLHVDYNSDCPEGFIGDDGRLRQIFLNVIGNAIKFTKEGGVTVSVYLGPDKHVNIDITDTGIGIEAGKLEHIFDQFTQADNSTSRRFGGTGLGLSISRKLALTMGGDILVRSEMGKGATFSVHLPLPIEPSVPLISENVIDTPEITETDPSSSNTLSGPTVVFLSRSPILFNRLGPQFDRSDLTCVGATSVGEMRTYLGQRVGETSGPTIIVLEWVRSMSEFLPYAEKLKSFDGCMDLKFILCTPNVLSDVSFASIDVAIMQPPHDKAALVKAVAEVAGPGVSIQAS